MRYRKFIITLSGAKHLETGEGSVLGKELTLLAKRCKHQPTTIPVAKLAAAILAVFCFETIRYFRRKPPQRPSGQGTVPNQIQTRNRKSDPSALNAVILYKKKFVLYCTRFRTIWTFLMQGTTNVPMQLQKGQSTIPTSNLGPAKDRAFLFLPISTKKNNIDYNLSENASDFIKKHLSNLCQHAGVQHASL